MWCAVIQSVCFASTNNARFLLALFFDNKKELRAQNKGFTGSLPVIVL